MSLIAGDYDEDFGPFDPVKSQTGLLEPYFGAYDFDYYSASQCGVYIGDILLDEIIRIGWSHVHSKTPIFSYASSFFETVAWGQEIVQGSFAINFKEAAYLQLVLRYYQSLTNEDVPVTTDGSGGHSYFAMTARNNIESIMRHQNIDMAKKGNTQFNVDETLANHEYDVLEQLYGFADMKSKEGSLTTGQLNSIQDFEQIAETCENAVWKDQLTEAGLGNVSNNSLTVPTHSDGFNIYLTYGNYDNPLANHTGKKITEVHLTSQGQTIQLDGNPLFEVYDFLARGVDIAG